MKTVFLNFPHGNPDFYTQLSCVAFAGKDMWVGADEGQGLVRLTTPDGGETWNADSPLMLSRILDLPSKKGEMDLEGMDFDSTGNFLWLVGSHGLKRKKPGVPPDLNRLAWVEPDKNRYLLCRVPLAIIDGSSVPRESTGHADPAFAAQFECDNPPFRNAILDALEADPHFGRFLRRERAEMEGDDVDLLGIPGKDNGIDIEGLAFAGTTETGAARLFLGLRGPVLRGWAAVIEIHVKAVPPVGSDNAGRLELESAGAEGRPHRRIFLELDGLGIRDLCFEGDDLMILAGPTMVLDWPVTVYRWKGAKNAGLHVDQIMEQSSGALDPVDVERSVVGDGEKGNRAEGMALYPFAAVPSLLVVFDAPGPSRLQAGAARVTGDVLALPVLQSDF